MYTYSAASSGFCGHFSVFNKVSWTRGQLMNWNSSDMDRFVWMMETLPADMSSPDMPGHLHLLIFLLWDCLFISVESSAGSELYLNLPFMSVEQRLGTSMALCHLWLWLPRGEILPSDVCPRMSEAVCGRRGWTRGPTAWRASWGKKTRHLCCDGVGFLFIHVHVVT